MKTWPKDTASTETPASGLVDKTPALSSDAEDVKPLTKAGMLGFQIKAVGILVQFQESRAPTFLERKRELREPLPSALQSPPGLFVPSAPEPSEVPCPPFGRLGTATASTTVDSVDDEAEVTRMAELLSNRVLHL